MAFRFRMFSLVVSFAPNPKYRSAVVSETYSISPASLDGLPAAIDEACSRMEQHYAEGRYSKVTVLRHWSKHNPTISGKIARPTAYRWYLRRELLKLAQR